jgi:hypothetical protein
MSSRLTPLHFDIHPPLSCRGAQRRRIFNSNASNSIVILNTAKGLHISHPSSGKPTFVVLLQRPNNATNNADRLCLEDVASGYWTLPFKQSSGLVSHYGSTPSSSAGRSTIDLAVRIILFDRQRTDWHQPRLTTGAFVFLPPCHPERSGGIIVSDSAAH